MLVLVRSALGSGHKIAICSEKRNVQWNTAYQIQIGSKELFSDLLLLGMTPAKSKKLQLPQVPLRFQSDFVRGYFDGDGCIYFKWLKYADRKNLRPVMLSSFTSGSKGFLEDLHVLLRSHGVSGGTIRKKQRGFDLALSHRDSQYSLIEE